MPLGVRNKTLHDFICSIEVVRNRSILFFLCAFTGYIFPSQDGYSLWIIAHNDLLSLLFTQKHHFCCANIAILAKKVTTLKFSFCTNKTTLSFTHILLNLSQFHGKKAYFDSICVLIESIFRQFWINFETIFYLYVILIYLVCTFCSLKSTHFNVFSFMPVSSHFQLILTSFWSHKIVISIQINWLGKKII